MKHTSVRRPVPVERRVAAGFTLIEVMVTVAIVAILAAVAIPNYSDYLRRGNVQEAVQNLSSYRAQMEQYYQDHRNYGSSGTTCGITVPGTVKNFGYACSTANSGQGYTATATGQTGTNVAGMAYTIDQQNAQGTTCTSCTWGFGTATSWVLRKP